MGWSDEDLEYIFQKSGGECFHCGGRIVRGNYGNLEARTGWEVDHGNPRSKGGSDRMQNLHASHPHCNRSKSDRTTGEYRRRGW